MQKSKNQIIFLVSYYIKIVFVSMDVFGKLITSSKCIAPQPWLCPPAVQDYEKVYKGFGDDPNDIQREQNWAACRKRRALEVLPIAILIACIIILVGPKQLEPYIDDIGYGVAIIGIVSYLTAEYRARMEYRVYVMEREMSGFNQKEFVNYKKRNFGPQWFEWI